MSGSSQQTQGLTQRSQEKPGRHSGRKMEVRSWRCCRRLVEMRALCGTWGGNVEGADGQKGEAQELRSGCHGVKSESWVGEEVGAERG